MEGAVKNHLSVPVTFTHFFSISICTNVTELSYKTTCFFLATEFFQGTLAGIAICTHKANTVQTVLVCGSQMVEQCDAT